MWEKRHFQGRNIKKTCNIEPGEEMYELPPSEVKENRTGS